METPLSSMMTSRCSAKKKNRDPVGCYGCWPLQYLEQAVHAVEPRPRQACWATPGAESVIQWSNDPHCNVCFQNLQCTLICTCQSCQWSGSFHPKHHILRGGLAAAARTPSDWGISIAKRAKSKRSKLEERQHEQNKKRQKQKKTEIHQAHHLGTALRVWTCHNIFNKNLGFPRSHFGPGLAITSHSYPWLYGSHWQHMATVCDCGLRLWVSGRFAVWCTGNLHRWHFGDHLRAGAGHGSRRMGGKDGEVELITSQWHRVIMHYET